ncbi:MAG: DUF2073 domain-containing protein [Methanobrevibacter sp.]|jgi:hypothetical protein|nr:DUF2073 domain-containing protein [Candidatus Methanovirga aequatorialis]
MEELKMDFISSNALKSATSMEKIYMIIERVKKGNVVVMDGGLTPAERAELIETTMREIDVDNFVGVDVHTLEKDSTSFFGLSKKKTVVITIVGPANLMKTIKKQANFLSMVANLERSSNA